MGQTQRSLRVVLLKLRWSGRRFGFVPPMLRWEQMDGSQKVTLSSLLSILIKAYFMP